MLRAVRCNRRVLGLCILSTAFTDGILMTTTSLLCFLFFDIRVKESSYNRVKTELHIMISRELTGTVKVANRKTTI